jgi:hypothetical protein
MMLMIKNKNVLITYKLVFGLLGLSAVVTEMAVLIGRGRFIPANFFSFFTIESNIFAAAIFIVSAVALWLNKSVKYAAMLRGASTLYMVTTGIVFAVLLSGLEANVLTAVPWDNTVLHYIMPLAVFFDWFIDPPKRIIVFKAAVIWLTYPIAYVMYSLIRGHIVGWYPYPFLDPDGNGYIGVVITSIGIAATVLALTWALVRLNKGRW